MYYNPDQIRYAEEVDDQGNPITPRMVRVDWNARFALLNKFMKEGYSVHLDQIDRMLPDGTFIYGYIVFD